MTRLYQCISSSIDPKNAMVSGDVEHGGEDQDLFHYKLMRWVSCVQKQHPTCTKKTRRWLFCAPNLTQLAVGRLCRR